MSSYAASSLKKPRFHPGPVDVATGHWLPHRTFNKTGKTASTIVESKGGPEPKESERVLARQYTAVEEKQRADRREAIRAHLRRTQVSARPAPEKTNRKALCQMQKF